jgi:hypothetical protein
VRASVDTAERRAGLPDSPVALIDILLSSLEALAAAGQADAACRLAGKACAALRGRDPAGWRRFNVFLHRMTKHVS